MTNDMQTISGVHGNQFQESLWNLTSVGEIVRMARQYCRLTLREVARRSKISPMEISYIERGLQRPRPDTTKKIARVLDLDVSRLLELVAKEKAYGEIDKAFEKLMAIAEELPAENRQEFFERCFDRFENIDRRAGNCETTENKVGEKISEIASISTNRSTRVETAGRRKDNGRTGKKNVL